MRNLLIISFILLSYLSNAQAVTTVYADRCTGEMRVFTVPLTGSTVITFYGQSQSFSAQDFRNGSLQSWLESVYLSWRSINPCSQAQTENNVLQTTVQEVAKSATQAAATAVPVPEIPQTNEIPITPDPPATPAVEVQAPAPEVAATPDPPVQQTEATPSVESDVPQGGDTPIEGSDTGNTQGPENDSTETDISDTPEAQEDSSPEPEATENTDSENSESSQENGEADGENQESESESENVEEEPQEETNNEEETESDESSEENSEEESTEEESTEEEDESSSDEDSQEEDDNEGGKKKKKKRKKKRNTAPPIIVANISSMQGVDGKFQQAMTMGLSKSSLRGDKSYGVTAMVWQNLKQFMLMGTYSKIFFKEGKPFMVYSAGLGASKMFTTVVGMTNHSVVFLGKKGFVMGGSLGLTSIFLNYDYYKKVIDFDDNILSSNVTTFFTKPYLWSERVTISPMVAASKQIMNNSLYGEQSVVSKDWMFITGTNIDYALTKRFKANLGINGIINTNKEIPTTLTLTIGSRFSF